MADSIGARAGMRADEVPRSASPIAGYLGRLELAAKCPLGKLRRVLTFVFRRAALPAQRFIRSRRTLVIADVKIRPKL